MQAWLDGWTERRNLWRERMSRGNDRLVRYPSCERHMGLVVVDGYTLDGVYSEFLGRSTNDAS
jgi:hypothetical protein